MQKIPFETEALRKWFNENKRDLPWRQTRDPYAVWVSEIMLQQTQVAVVLEYFDKWMLKFPTIQSLAEASLEEVIKLWEGLGYYSRARHLHAAACYLTAHHGAQLPSTREELAKVKGLGPYTIGAILSFAFRKKAAAVDGNVIRVLSRYLAITDAVDAPKTVKSLRDIAERILPEEKPWEVVEGLIELGAMVCKKDPQCKFCPLKKGCEGYRIGIQSELPKKERKVQITLLERHVFVIESEGSLLVKKGSKGEVMADLYEFPYSDNQNFPFSFKAIPLKTLEQQTHSFTRYRVILYPTLWQAERRVDVADYMPKPIQNLGIWGKADAGKNQILNGFGYMWVAIRDIGNYPFSSGHRKILNGFLNADITYGKL